MLFADGNVFKWVMVLYLQLDVGDKLRGARGEGPGAECLGDVYDAARGLPVLHDTALQLTVAFADTDVGPTVREG